MEDLKDRVSSKISTAGEQSQSEIDDGAVKKFICSKNWEKQTALSDLERIITASTK